MSEVLNIGVVGANYARLAATTLTSGEVSALNSASWAAPQVHDAIQNTEITIINPVSDAGGTTFITAEMDNGVTLEVTENTLIANIDGGVVTLKTGSSGGGAATTDTIKFLTYITDKTTVEEWRSQFGGLVLAQVGYGFNAAGTSMGTCYLMGKMTGDLVRGTAGQEFITMQVSIAGASWVAATGFDESDINTVFNVVTTPIGGTPSSGTGTFTPAAMTAPGLVDLLLGKIVIL